MAGKWRYELFKFRYGIKDKELSKGGSQDEPIWHDKFCL